MAKFKNLKTGNTLTVTNETAIALMKANPKRYQELTEKATKSSGKKADKEDKEE